jgi:DNA-binding GntR family transcriptional regulator
MLYLHANQTLFMQNPLYRNIQNALKLQIQQGDYRTGDYLPSENKLCAQYNITRTTARKALEELVKEGFIERLHGKGSQVIERRKSLGLLNLKGFSEAVGENVRTFILQEPDFRPWISESPFRISETELNTLCIHFERLRCVGDVPVMHENNWFSSIELPDFIGNEFIEGSFFKTLSQKYHIEITGSEQEIRAISANEKTANLLHIKSGSPILHIFIHFSTSKQKLNIYAELFCNTSKYPVGNKYHL